MKIQEVPTQELVEIITAANESYRVGKQFLSDTAYDNLINELTAREPNHELLKKGIIEQAPTTRKRKLQTQMMSLDKLKSVAELQKKFQSLGLSGSELLVITPKYNGISLENDTYEGTASTRGDGEYGQNCDPHYQQMNHSTVLDNNICIGEAIISRKNWNDHFKGKLSPKGMPYKLNNATVAGLLNNEVPTDELKYVDYIRYGIVAGQDSDIDKFLQLQAINQTCHNEVRFNIIELNQLEESHLDELFHSWNKEYPIDGLVIDINRYTLREKLGRLSNGNPAYAYALKLDKWVEEFETVITGYDFTISKQGKLRGVVTFEPVIIEGTEVKQASFYNYRFLRDFFLFPGVNITVKKSGEIIPKIMSVEGIVIPRQSDYKSTKEYYAAYEQAEQLIATELCHREDTIPIPQLMLCPSCDSELQMDDNGVDLECHNPHCDSMLISKLEHFFLAIGVEEFGRPSIETLYNYGHQIPINIMSLSKKEFAAIPGFGDSSAELIISQFEKIINTGLPLARILYAYDLFEGKIGEDTAQKIFNELDGKDITRQSLLTLKGVSDITADCFIKGLLEHSKQFHFIPITYMAEPKKVILGDRYTGFSVCFSGIRSKELEEEIVANGGKIASGVSKTTTHLVVLDPYQGTSKTVKAKELGCKVLTIEQFKII